MDSDVVHVIDRPVPVFPVHDQAEMRHRDVMRINRISQRGWVFADEVRAQLVAEEIKVDPGRRRASNLAAQNIYIESACGFQIPYGEG